MARYRIEATLLEDLHSGTGTGGGDFDALQMVDRYDRPVVRSTHLRGLLLEAARELKTLDMIPQATVEALFGAKGGARRGFLLQSLYLDQGGAMLGWGASARKVRDRSPMPDTLRTIQYVAAGSRFVGDVEILDKGLIEPFELCLRHTPTLGSRKRRGRGLVKFSFVQQEPPRSAEGSDPGRWRKSERPGLRLRILLRNLEALCLADTGQPENIIPSESHLRGGAVISAMVSRLLDLGHPDVAGLLLEHCVASNALPLPTTDFRAVRRRLDAVDVVPFPLNLLTPKPRAGGDSGWPWWAVKRRPGYLGTAEEVDALGDLPHDSEKPKRPGSHEYLCRVGSGEPWQRYSPLLGIHMRTQVPGIALFAEEEIAEDTLFLTELRFNPEAFAQDKLYAQEMQDILGGKVWLAAGRGGRPIEVLDAQWVPCPAVPDQAANDSFTLYLESDLIVRDAELRFFTGIDGEMLAAALNNPGAAAGCDVAAVSDNVMIHGFNAASGLRRAPAIAIRRGSTARISGRGAARLRKHLVDKLLSEAPWLGERTEEGFGRYRVDFEPLLEPRMALFNDSSAGVSREIGDAEATLQRTRALASQIVGGPSNSQWGALAEVAKGAASKEDIVKVLEQLQHDARDKVSAKAWQNVQLDSLIDVVKRMDGMPSARFFVLSLVRWLRLGKAAQ